jgi:hypothetical protein
MQSMAATFLMFCRVMIDPGFPDHRRQNRASETVERAFGKCNLETAEIAGRLDIPNRVAASQKFFEYRLQRMADGQELFLTAPDLKLPDAFTRPSVLILADLMHSQSAGYLTSDYLKLGINIVS